MTPAIQPEDKQTSKARSPVLCESKEHVAVLTLNNPDKRNALSREMLAGLKDELSRITGARQIKVVIIRATGSVFSSGHNLRELANGSTEEHASLFALCTDVMETIRKMPQPVIAQVQGVATAAGCQLAASCDLVVAAEEATFATPGVKIGLFCTTPGVALARAVAPRKAFEMLLTGTPISAREAERIGLVGRVVPADRLEEETMNLAKQIASASASTIAIGKAAFYAQLRLPTSEAYALAQKVMVENAQTPDAKEGMTAFLEKRAPKWRE